jgi:hypothetical protein
MFPSDWYLKYLYAGVKMFLKAYNIYILTTTWIIFLLDVIAVFIIYDDLLNYILKVSYLRSDNHARLIKKAVESSNFVEAEKLLDQYKNSKYGKEKTYQSLNVIVYCCKYNKKIKL